MFKYPREREKEKSTSGLRPGPGLKKWWAGKSEVGGFRGTLDQTGWSIRPSNLTKEGQCKMQVPRRRVEDKDVSEVDAGVFKFTGQKKSVLLLSEDDLRCHTPKKEKRRS